MSYTLGEHHRAAMDVETDDQANALHAKLWQHRNDHHERMSPAELDDVEKALHELEIGDASGQLAKHRRNWQRRQTRVGEQQLRRDDARKPRARATVKAKQTATRTRQRAPRAARRAFQRTGVPAAAQSATSMVLQTLGLVIGLSVAYLVLTNAERRSIGSSAIGMFAKGVSRGVQLLIAPVDPLNPKAGKKLPPLPKPSVNPTVNPLAAGPPAPHKTAGVQRVLPNYTDLLGATPTK